MPGSVFLPLCVLTPLRENKIGLHAKARRRKEHNGRHRRLPAAFRGHGEYDEGHKAQDKEAEESAPNHAQFTPHSFSHE